MVTNPKGTILLAVGLGRYTINYNFRKPKTITNSTDLDSLGVSPIGPKLLNVISMTRFMGLSGNSISLMANCSMGHFRLSTWLGEVGERLDPRHQH